MYSTLASTEVAQRRESMSSCDYPGSSVEKVQDYFGNHPTLHLMNAYSIEAYSILTHHSRHNLQIGCISLADPRGPVDSILNKSA